MSEKPLTQKDVEDAKKQESEQKKVKPEDKKPENKETTGGYPPVKKP